VQLWVGGRGVVGQTKTDWKLKVTVTVLCYSVSSVKLHSYITNSVRSEYVLMSTSHVDVSLHSVSQWKSSRSVWIVVVHCDTVWRWGASVEVKCLCGCCCAGVLAAPWWRWWLSFVVVQEFWLHRGGDGDWSSSVARVRRSRSNLQDRHRTPASLPASRPRFSVTAAVPDCVFQTVGGRATSRQGLTAALVSDWSLNHCGSVGGTLSTAQRATDMDWCGDM